jgi:hypothetical protein
MRTLRLRGRAPVAARAAPDPLQQSTRPKRLTGRLLSRRLPVWHPSPPSHGLRLGRLTMPLDRRRCSLTQVKRGSLPKSVKVANPVKVERADGPETAGAADAAATS